MVSYIRSYYLLHIKLFTFNERGYLRKQLIVVFKGLSVYGYDYQMTLNFNCYIFDKNVNLPQHPQYIFA